VQSRSARRCVAGILLYPHGASDGLAYPAKRGAAIGVLVTHTVTQAIVATLGAASAANDWN